MSGEIREPPPLTEDAAEPLKPDRLFEVERGFVSQNWERLKAEYGGRYIAVLETSVLDSDAHFSPLAERVYRRFGYKRILMPFIGESRRI